MTAEQAFDNFLHGPDFRQYRTRKDECGIWEIECRHGNIQPYSMDLKWLCAYIVIRFPGALIARLPAYCIETQRGTGEIIFKFPTDRLSEVAPLIHARRRRVLSEKRRLALLVCSEGTRFSRHTVIGATEAV